MRNKAVRFVCAAAALALVGTLFTGCKDKAVDGTAAAITVNDEVVTMGAANFNLRYQQADTYSMLISYGLAAEGTVWNQMISADQTYGELFKDSVEADLVDKVLVRQHAAEYGVELTEEDKAAAAAAAADFMEANKESSVKIGCTAEDVENILLLSTVYNRMTEPVKEDADTTIDEAEAVTAKILYAQLPIKADTEANETEVTEDRKAKLKSEVVTLIDGFKSLKEADVDLAAEMAQAIDTDFYVAEGTYSEYNNTLPEELVSAAKLLKNGEIGQDVIESSNYYYAVWMVNTKDADATEATKHSMIEDLKNEYFVSVVASWKEESSITYSKEWKSLTVTDTGIYEQPKAEETSSESSGTSEASSASEAESTSVSSSSSSGE